VQVTMMMCCVLRSIEGCLSRSVCVACVNCLVNWMVGDKEVSTKCRRG
jgi:hypothetical protein